VLTEKKPEETTPVKLSKRFKPTKISVAKAPLKRKVNVEQYTGIYAASINSTRNEIDQIWLSDGKGTQITGR